MWLAITSSWESWNFKHHVTCRMKYYGQFSHNMTGNYCPIKLLAIIVAWNYGQYYHEDGVHVVIIASGGGYVGKIVFFTSVHKSNRLSSCLVVHSSACLPACLSVRPSVCLHVCKSVYEVLRVVCLSIRLSVNTYISSFPALILALLPLYIFTPPSLTLSRSLSLLLLLSISSVGMFFYVGLCAFLYECVCI